MSDASCPTTSKCGCEFACANLILRLWIGLRLFMAGIDKFRPKGTTTYEFGNMEVLKKNAQPIYDNMLANTFMPGPMISMYIFVLTFSLMIVGAWVMIGLFTRASLFFAGLLFVSLSFGLMALPDDDQAVFRGIEVGLTALALMTAGRGIIGLDGLFFRSKKAKAE